MAFSAVTFRGGQVSNANGTTVSVSPNANVVVGEILFAVAGSDNDATTDGQTTLHSISDSKGNTWTKVREQTETDGAANDGSTASIWWTKVETEITTGDTVTLTLGVSKSDKCIGLLEVTVGAGNVVAVEQVGVGQNSLTATVTGMTSREYLLVGWGVAEGEDSTKTPDADYTERWDNLTSTTGLLDVNLSFHLQSRIATLTTDTMASTGWTFTNVVQLLAAMYEVAGAQSLSVPLFTNSSTLYDHTIAPQAVSLTVPLFTNTSVLYEPTVEQIIAAQDVTLPLFTNTSTLYEPSLVVGSVDVTLPLFSNTSTLFEPTLVSNLVLTFMYALLDGNGEIVEDGEGNPVLTEGSYVLEPSLVLNVEVPLFTNTSVLYDPTIEQLGGGAQTVSLPLFSNTSTLYEPTVTTGAVSVTIPLFTNTSDLFAPTIATGATNLTAPLLTNTSTLYEPTLTVGSVNVTLPLFSNTSILYEPVLDTGQVNLNLPLLSNTSDLFAPTVQVGAVSLTLPLFTNSSTLYEPSVTLGGVSINTPLLTNSSTLYEPTITVGAVTVELPLFSNSNTLYTPSVGVPPIELGLSFIDYTGTLYSPIIEVGGAAISTPLIEAANVLYGPTITVGGVTITLDLFTNTSSLFAPSLSTGMGWKVYVGGQWKVGAMKAWNGEEWTGTLKIFTQNQWEEL
jgi:hypothetical protein